MFGLIFAVSFYFLYVNASFRSLRGSSLSTFLDEEDEWKQFTLFQDKFNKKYDSMEDLEGRFQIFRSNVRNIILHNLDHTQNYTMGINQFTDLTQEEFRDKYVTGYKKVQSFSCTIFSSEASDLPDSIDWTIKGVVNSVRDQGQCGSCWAFATTANAESVWAISTGKLLDLSEEYLVDCATGIGYFNMGCNGGNPDSALKYMVNYGQCSETSYPYTSGTTKKAGPCEKCIDAGIKFSGCFDVRPNDQVSLKSAVSYQPVVIAIEADTRYFQSYSSGILTDEIKCGTQLDHAVEIVGYGSENGIDYWKVRNSWGTSWGEKGYVRIQRTSSTNDIGVCGIAAEPSFIYV
jgi:C1A family cysteine protease